MAYPKSSASALLALATAGGLWAWQNRGKLTTMVQQMQAGRQTQPPATSTLPAGPYTDATRRLEGDEIERGSGEGI